MSAHRKKKSKRTTIETTQRWAKKGLKISKPENFKRSLYNRKKDLVSSGRKY